ncbi:hypothetical protein L682_22180 [Aquipseudomonas alcaligenes OT 69]|nr:hypothetical protein L682_22180 [Pseudomonas alcaligenes OT 69]
MPFDQFPARGIVSISFGQLPDCMQVIRQQDPAEDMEGAGTTDFDDRFAQCLSDIWANE